MSESDKIWLLTPDEEAELRKSYPMPEHQVRQAASVGAVVSVMDKMTGPLLELIANLEKRLNETVHAHNTAVETIKSLRTQVADLNERKGLEYQGTHEHGRQYRKGDFVTCAGSLWHANEPTTQKPGDGSAWSLAVKRGRDGKDMR